MKKVFIFTALILVLFAVASLSGCIESGEIRIIDQQTTDASTTEVSAIPVIDDISETETVSQTAIVNTSATATVPTAASPTATVPTSPTPTAAPSTEAPTSTASTTETPSTSAPTTAKPTEAQQPAGTPELLNSYVLAPIRSGKYTMTISAFGEDKSTDDKLMKIVNGNEVAFWFSVPAANMAFKVFSNSGKYYLAMGSQYCELTKEQYDQCCNTFNKGMYDFSGLQYKKTETVRDGLTKYTCEYFTTPDGTNCVLWFKNNQLSKFEVLLSSGSESLPITVSSSVNTSYFNLGADLEQVDYENLKSLVDLAMLFFG